MTSSNTSEPTEFKDIHQAELDYIIARRSLQLEEAPAERTSRTSQDELLDATGLALSGGGIRSATYALGGLIAGLYQSLDRWLLDGERNKDLILIRGKSDLSKVAVQRLLSDDATRELLLRQVEENYSRGLIDRNAISRLRNSLRTIPDLSTTADSRLNELKSLKHWLSERSMQGEGTSISSIDSFTPFERSHTDGSVAKFATDTCLVLKGSSPLDASSRVKVATPRKQLIEWRKMLLDSTILSVKSVTKEINGWSVIVDALYHYDSLDQEPRPVEYILFIGDLGGELRLDNLSQQ